MNSRLILFTVILIPAIWACTCNNRQSGPESNDTLLVIPDTLLVYELDVVTKQARKNGEVPDSAYTPQRVLNGLNEKYPEVQLKWIGQQHDTLFVRVVNSEFLGEQMGSTGAADWYADVVLNLTASNGVRYVSIDMEKQSHALPGVFSRDDMSDYSIVRDSLQRN